MINVMRQGGDEVRGIRKPRYLRMCQ